MLLKNKSVWGLEVVVLVVVDCNRLVVYHRLLGVGDAGDGYYTYHCGLLMSFFWEQTKNILLVISFFIILVVRSKGRCFYRGCG